MHWCLLVSCYTSCSVGNPQSFVFVPLLFTIYISPISTIANSYHTQQQQHTQIYGSCSPSHVDMFVLAVLTFKTQQTSLQYLSQHISLRTSARNTRSSSVPLLCVPFRRTSFARRSFSTAAPLTWNSLPPAVLNCDSLSTFKSRLKTHVFCCFLLTVLPTCSASASLAA